MFESHATTGAMPIWVICNASQGHDDIWAWVADKDHIPVHGFIAARVYVDVRGGPGCHQRPQGGPGSAPLPETMLLLEGCITARPIQT